MPSTPKPLLEVLDFITRDSVPAPRGAAVGVQVESLQAVHVERVRKTFDDPNIVGVGISRKVTEGKELDALCVCFYVVRKLAPSKIQSRYMVPPVLAASNGKATFTDVKVVGQLLPEKNPLIKRKPIESAFSVGHFNITAGTLGAIVKKGSKRYLLSNSHVLADSGRGRPGDKVLYPGKEDGGEDPADWIATLSEAVPFTKGGAFVNEVDAALAEIREERMAQVKYVVPRAAVPFAIGVPQRDMIVTKRGRTTGVTSGKIIDTDFRFVLPYDGVGQVGFTRQVLCERYSGPGDSGSLIVDAETGKVVGLHFAGANGGSVFNPIQSVIKALKFKFTAS